MLVIGGAAAKSGAAGSGTAVGSCGELVQGFTSAGIPFHVTLPIEKSSTVSVTLNRASEFKVSQIGPGSGKLEKSLLSAAAYLDIEPCEIRVAHWTDLTPGKGMGSSTADIVAAARALGNAVGRELNSAELASIAVGIESSDGTMYQGIVAFNQKKGLLYRFNWYPQFIVVMITPPKQFNTESARFEGKESLGVEFDEILANLKEAAANKDVVSFAEFSTRSARMNQKFVPNPYFAILEEKYKDFGALGVNVAHTGTLVGLLFDADDPQGLRKASAATVEVQGLFPGTEVEMTLTPAWRPESI
jgi:L-threonine kinase